jgi:hypothetical protein
MPCSEHLDAINSPSVVLMGVCQSNVAHHVHMTHDLFLLLVLVHMCRLFGDVVSQCHLGLVSPSRVCHH